MWLTDIINEILLVESCVDEELSLPFFDWLLVLQFLDLFTLFWVLSTAVLRSFGPVNDDLASLWERDFFDDFENLLNRALVLLNGVK